MREIKFRAWDKKFKKMYIGDIRVVLAYPDSDIEYMQFTGLLDHHGKEIWEGDIVRTYRNSIGLICWGNKSCSFYIKCSNAYYTSDKRLTLSNVKEVIGNIYENPELIKD